MKLKPFLAVVLCASLPFAAACGTSQEAPDRTTGELLNALRQTANQTQTTSIDGIQITANGSVMQNPVRANGKLRVENDAINGDFSLQYQSDYYYAFLRGETVSVHQSKQSVNDWTGVSLTQTTLPTEYQSLYERALDLLTEYGATEQALCGGILQIATQIQQQYATRVTATNLVDKNELSVECAPSVINMRNNAHTLLVTLRDRAQTAQDQTVNQLLNDQTLKNYINSTNGLTANISAKMAIDAVISLIEQGNLPIENTQNITQELKAISQTTEKSDKLGDILPAVANVIITEVFNGEKTAENTTVNELALKLSGNERNAVELINYYLNAFDVATDVTIDNVTIKTYFNTNDKIIGGAFVLKAASNADQTMSCDITIDYRLKSVTLQQFH